MVSCGDSSKTPPKVDPAITEYVSAFTAGIVSSEAKIRVIFNKNVLSAKPSETADKNLFDFSPNINGQAIWVDSRTLEFTPEEPMKNGKLFEGNLDLTKLFSNVPSELEELPLHFQLHFLLPVGVSLEKVLMSMQLGTGADDAAHGIYLLIISKGFS